MEKMNGEEKFFALCWGLVAAVVISIVVSVTAYNMHQNALVTDMVSHGASPVTVHCALNPAYDVCKFSQIKD